MERGLELVCLIAMRECQSRSKSQKFSKSKNFSRHCGTVRRGQNFVGQDVTGAISLGQNVVGQEVSGAGSCGAGRHWEKIPGAERRGAGMAVKYGKNWPKNTEY